MADKIKIAIVGGGTAGWMTAAALAGIATDKICELILVESEAIGTVGVGEATIPAIKEFNDRLGIPETEMLQQTRATFKLGIEFQGWGKPGTSYIHPFGTFGQPIAGTDFHQQWLRFFSDSALRENAGLSQQLPPLEAYSLAVQMCRAGKFDYPKASAGSALDPIESSYAYAYHFDAGLYARYLRDYAEQRGVRRIEGRIHNVSQDPHSGDIQTLHLESGQQISADYFIDCSGFRSLLLGQTLGVAYQSWKHWLPCDSAVAMPSARDADLPPVTRSTAQPAGWQWRIPLQHRCGNGFVYQSSLIGDDEAADSLASSLKTPAIGDPRIIRFEAGKRACSWHKNCIAVGLAAGFLEPLESTSIYLIQAAIVNFLKLLPGKSLQPQLAREFNRLLNLEYERARDFIILHYHLNPRTDSELWRHCQSMSIPDELRLRIEAFRKRGFIEQYRHGLFAPPSWLSVFMGQGLKPRQVEPLANQVDPHKAAQTLSSLEQTIRRQIAAMPSSAEFVQQLNSMPAEEMHA
ncbi:tryptophan 7-halogenase [Microbulbifer bruguierae]|uniref:Tryptophan 7-halogenase n=1 Tax=Microbulbifer bruguierae TaxID=3029061 RepID=A0ABY8NHI2_9GAMM|nr:tryptophan 7-halogenase [Microbulbifer bruguierae]WGL18386.1 tryptophan 7-halogenase [Microbulbifer bruguierae]